MIGLVLGRVVGEKIEDTKSVIGSGKLKTDNPTSWNERQTRQIMVDKTLDR